MPVNSEICKIIEAKTIENEKDLKARGIFAEKRRRRFIIV